MPTSTPSQPWTKLNAVIEPDGLVVPMRLTDNAVGAHSSLDLDLDLDRDLYRLEVEWNRDPHGTLLTHALNRPRPEATPSVAWLWLVVDAWMDAVTLAPELAGLRSGIVVELPDSVVDRLLEESPWMIGAEFLTNEWMMSFWKHIAAAFDRELAGFGGSVSEWMEARGGGRHQAGRVCFHLVENKTGEAPFAFLATYAQELTADQAALGQKPRHVPLRAALTEYGRDGERMRRLLETVSRAASASPMIADLLASGEIFHPLSFTASEAYRFLEETEIYERAGVLCRIPNWWKGWKTTARLQVTLGSNPASGFGVNELVDFQASLLIDDEPLTPAEIEKLLLESEGLLLIKGRWQAVNHAQLRETLKAYREAQKLQKKDGLTFAEAFHFQLHAERMLRAGETEGPAAVVEVSQGSWLRQVSDQLRHPELLAEVDPGEGFLAELRPYQQKGLAWLESMRRMGFGACLADDMGLGKTVQVIALLNAMWNSMQNATPSLIQSERRSSMQIEPLSAVPQSRESSKRNAVQHAESAPPTRVLLVVPASLVGNWIEELDRFAPALPRLVVHRALGSGAEALEDESLPLLTLTTYGMISRSEAFRAIRWTLLILDEAQAIRNPGTAQTRAVKQLQADGRIAMTGTPVENRLSDLWSLFDFLNRGMLGSASEFKAFMKRLETDASGITRLKGAVGPFILRRLKTDRSIISDLPDKVEVKVYAGLSRRQAALYQQQVDRITESLAGSGSEIGRRGLILSALMRFKQICNHPDQLQGQDGWAESDSGKLQRLREICEQIRERRERVLVFTQFREITEPLSRFLSGVFGREGLMLHGGTPVKERRAIVAAFQSADWVPFMVLSIKAGGVGLNLTAASHVIHFDRWWNPAVENQATDRAYRIGQKKNVMVHKFVTEGTLEEKIDRLLEEKRKLAGDILPDSQEAWLTEMGDAELMALMRLDVRE